VRQGKSAWGDTESKDEKGGLEGNKSKPDASFRKRALLVKLNKVRTGRALKKELGPLETETVIGETLE